MGRTFERMAVAGSIALALAMIGCGGGADLEQIVQEGQLVAEFDGRQVPLAVDVMDVFLVDPDWEDDYPETFVIEGADVQLVGTFPMNLRVGYGEDFSKMLGRSVEIDSGGDVNGQARRSRLKLAGLGGEVRGGTMVVEKILGQNPEGAGQILEGQITLQMDDSRTVQARFQMLAVTWG